MVPSFRSPGAGYKKDDWDEVLKHLTVCGDEAVQQLAQTEVKNPDDFAGRIALADAWAKLAESARGSEAKQYLGRAAYWYRQCHGEASGTEQARITRFLKKRSYLEFGRVRIGGTLEVRRTGRRHDC